jgi:DNA-binding response OmpR family regulator
MKKILVAEDDKFLASAYQVKLTKAGFDVTVVSDGNEVLTFLKNTIPDVILLDLVMPVKDCYSTLKEIKEHKDYISIPVIIASNLGQSEDIAKGMKLGAVDYIVKSDTSLDELIKKIETHIKG